jgi:type II secretory pathway component PulF
VVPFALNQFDVSIYIHGLLTILGLFYIPAGVIAAITIFSPKRGPLRLLLDTFVIRLPLVGKAIRELELSRYTKVFAVTYRAGIPIVRCAEMAAESVSNTVMFQRLEPAAQKARAGEEMSLGFNAKLPPEFIDLWAVGEESGQLDDSAWRLSLMHTENAERRFTTLAQWTPRIVYIIVAGVMIYYIFTGFQQIYGDIL